MATVEVRLPQWGMGMDDGVILEWKKAEGDSVVKGEELVDVESAKATAAVEAPASGVLVKIVAQPDEVVLVQQVIALIETK